MLRKPVYLLLIFLSFFENLRAQVKLEPHHIVLNNGLEFDLKIPRGYHISVAAQDMRRLRFLAKSPDGRLFATDMYSKDDNKNKGKVYLFENWDAVTRSFSTITVFADGLHNPNQVLFYSEKGKHFIYIAETGKLSRYEYHIGDRVVKGEPQVIACFPDYGLSYKYGGWHLTRSITQNGGKIYVSVGSSCNACIEKESIRATILEMDPDGKNQRIFASGLRNSVGIKWIGNTLWATSMGRDLLGPDKPEDLFMAIDNGKNYGWPWYFQFRQRIYSDNAMLDSAKKAKLAITNAPPLAYTGFAAHSAPLGFDRLAGFNDPQLKDHFLVALHGSTSVWRKRGNAVVMITGKDKYVEIVSNFLTGKEEKDRYGRPCDVMMNDANSFFVTDDKNGVLYYVWK